VADQMAILESAGEYSLLEQYRFALARREKLRLQQARRERPADTEEVAR
jgi:hypothetical protein